MLSVTIGSNDYAVYADVDYADIYLEADPSADAYRAATADTKGRALVSATRVLNIQNWRGSKTDTDQVDAWPRTGITGVDEDVTPHEIPDACCELANALLNGVDIVNFTSTAQTQKRIKAGSVEVENFRSVDIYGLPLPQMAWKLIQPYIGGDATAGARSTGTDGCSRTERPYDHSQSI